MFGKKPRLNPLASRKQLLIAESELNRAQLAEDWQAVADEISSLTARAKSFGTLASAAAVLVTSLIAFKQSSSGDADPKPSWSKRILQGAGWISSMWLAFRSAQRK